MKILAACDSRGDHLPSAWANKLAKRKGVNLTILRKVYPKRLYTIHLLAQWLKANNAKYDVIIIQLGHVEWQRAFTKTIWNNILPKHKLKKKYMIHITGDNFFYRDKQLIKSAFKEVKKHTDWLIGIGFHGWKTFSHARPLMDHESCLELNDIYSKYFDEYLFLPMHPTWFKSNVSDGVHYKKRGQKYIQKYISRTVGKPKTFFDAFSAIGPFVEIGGIKKTVKQLKKSARVKGDVIASMTKKGDVIAISNRTSFDQIENFIGAMLAGRIPVILPHPSSKVEKTYFDQKMQKVKQAVDPAICICDESDVESFKPHFNTVVDLPKSTDSVRPKYSPHDVAFIQLSSGTTGIPKVIKVSHQQIIDHCREYASCLSLCSTDVIVSWLPLYHDMGLIACFFLPLLSDCSFVHIDPFAWITRPLIMLEKIEKYKGTHVWLPNFSFSLLSKLKTECDLSSLKMVINCSEKCVANDMDKFVKHFEKNGLQKESIRICYALAENVFAATQSEGLKITNENGEKVLCCGIEIPGTSILIVDNDKDVTEQSEGHIYIRSSYSPLSNPKDFYGYCATGDMGFMKNGELYVLGRKDDMIINYGRNVFPYEIESMISDFDGVKAGRVACFGVFDKDRGTEEVVICLEVEHDIDIDVDVMKKMIYDTFSISVKIDKVDRGWIVKTSSGKISRKSTKKKYLNDR